MEGESLLVCIDHALTSLNQRHAPEANGFVALVKLNCKFESAALHIEAHETSLNIFVQPFLDTMTTPIIDEIVKLTTMINFGLRIGNYEFDLKEGRELRFVSYVECCDLSPSNCCNAISKAIHDAIQFVESTCDSIYDVIYNKASADKAIRLLG